jgi:hypothetical protein
MAEHRSFLTTVFLLLCSISFSQKIKFDVYLFSNKIGETIVESRDSAGQKIYSLRSTTDAKVLFVEKKSVMSTDVRFDKDEKLFSCFFRNIKNDEKFYTTSVRDGSARFIVNKDGVKTVVPAPITYSSIMLYFSEPPNLQKVYSERLGEFFQMVRQPDGTYLADLDGHSASYTYRAGKLTELEIKSSLGSVIMKRVHCIQISNQNHIS